MKSTRHFHQGAIAALLILSIAMVQAEPVESVEALMERAGGEPAALLRLIEEQREEGAPASILVPAEVIYALQSGDFSRAKAVAEALAVLAESDDLSEGAFFNRKEEVYAIRETMLAKVSLDAEDYEAFEKHIKEAFWLDPQMAPLLTGFMDEYEQARILSSVVFPMDREISFSDGSTTTMAKLAEGKKAILLDFWATWCGPCVSLMPELVKKHEALGPQGVLVAGMNTEGVEKAEAFRKERELTMPWLVEPSDRAFSALLAIDSIPRMILLTPEGKILFNGHPMDEALGVALAEVGVSL